MTATSLRPQNHSQRKSGIRIARLAACLLLLFAALPAAAQSGSTGDASLLHREGRWFVDSGNRVVTLHGVDGTWKSPPYFPPNSAKGFTAADADLLAANGFNAFRLGVTFAGVMPTKDVIDNNYLDQIDRVVKLLADRHIWVFIDFHQDQYSEKFNGEGFPSWAVYDDGLPNLINPPFPLGVVLNPLLQHTFDNFWANKNSIWDNYTAAVKAAVLRWRNQPYLLGYEIMNEPEAGTTTLTCLPPLGCPSFEQTLQNFQEHVLAGIRSADPDHLVMFEPQVGTALLPVPTWYGPGNDPNLVYSWHTYCIATALPSIVPPIGCFVPKGVALANALTQASTLGAVPLLTEFAADDNTLDIGETVLLADSQFVGWTYWAYKNWDAPNGTNAAAQGASLFANDTDLSSLKQDKLNVLSEPYAQAIAGLPGNGSYNIITGNYTLTYTPRASTAPTEIFLPKRHFSAGYQVQVSGAQVISAANAQQLLLQNLPGAGTVSLTVSPLH